VSVLSGWMKRRAKKSGARSKSKAGSKRGAGSSDSGERFGWRQAKPVLFTFLGALALCGAAYGWWAGEPALINFVNERHAAATGVPIDVRFTHPVVKVEGARDQLVRLVREHMNNTGPLGSHARAALRDARRALIETGWFDPENLRLRRDLTSPAQDDELQRAHDANANTNTNDNENIDDHPTTGNAADADADAVPRDTITIEGPFRPPFALVRHDEFDYLVNVEGRRLPVAYTARSVDAIPVIVGAGAGAPGIGEVWPGRDLRNGLELLEYLRGVGPAWLAQVRAIDVANAGGAERRNDPHLVLVTDKGYRVGWGRAIGDEAGIDIAPAEKVRLLNEYAKPRNGRIGDPLGLLRVDQPLSTIDRNFGNDNPTATRPGGG